MPKAKNKQKQKEEQNDGLNRDLNPGPVTFGSRCFSYHEGDPKRQSYD